MNSNVIVTQLGADRSGSTAAICCQPSLKSPRRRIALGMPQAEIKTRTGFPQVRVFT